MKGWDIMAQNTTRQTVLSEIKSRIQDIVSVNPGTSFSAPCISTVKPKSKCDYDFSVRGEKSVSRTIKVYTSQEFEANTAITKKVLNNSEIDYIAIYGEDNGLYVFKRDDILANSTTSGIDDRVHCTTIINSMPEFYRITSSENLRRIFDGY